MQDATANLNSSTQNDEEQNAWYNALIEMGEEWSKAFDQRKLADEVEQLEQGRIRDALTMSDGNKTHAANYLGIGRTLLLHKIKKYNIGSEDDASSNT